MIQASTRSVSRSDAIKRSCRVFDRASRQFRALPSAGARRAVELSMEALLRAELLSELASLNREGQFRHWEDAWLSAHLQTYRVTQHESQR